jgi:hypothetical protein
MIKRREFIAGLGSAVAWPVVARTLQPAVRKSSVFLNTLFAGHLAL